MCLTCTEQHIGYDGWPKYLGTHLSGVQRGQREFLTLQSAKPAGCAMHFSDVHAASQAGAFSSRARKHLKNWESAIMQPQFPQSQGVTVGYECVDVVKMNCNCSSQDIKASLRPKIHPCLQYRSLSLSWTIPSSSIHLVSILSSAVTGIMVTCCLLWVLLQTSIRCRRTPGQPVCGVFTRRADGSGFKHNCRSLLTKKRNVWRSDFPKIYAQRRGSLPLYGGFRLQNNRQTSFFIRFYLSCAAAEETERRGENRVCCSNFGCVIFGINPFKRVREEDVRGGLKETQVKEWRRKVRKHISFCAGFIKCLTFLESVDGAKNTEGIFNVVKQTSHTFQQT